MSDRGAHHPTEPGTPPPGDADLVHDATPGALDRMVTRGLGWSFANNVVSRLATVLSGIVLARILIPADYGVFAVAVVVLNAALSMNELGVSLAIVRWPYGVSRIAPTVTSLAIAWSAVLFTACYIAAPLVATTMNAPGATVMIRVLSVCILVDAIAAVPSAMITRRFQQRKRMAIDLTAFAVGTSLSIVLAILGWGAWAIVWGFAVSNITAGILAIALAPTRFRPGFDAGAARELLAFGLPLAGSSLVLFVMLNVDYIVVGHILGPVALGLYLMAFNLCSWPVNLVSAAVRRVSLAGFSRLADDPSRAGEVFSRSAALILGLTIPMCVFLAVFSAPTIDVLYGAKWLPSADALRLLCVLGAARVGLELVYDYLVAMGRTRPNLVLQLTWLVVLVPVLLVGARSGGIEGVAGGHAVVAVLVIGPVAALILRRTSVRLRRLFMECIRPLAAGVAVALIGRTVQEIFDGSFAQLLVGAALTGAACIVLLAPMRSTVRKLMSGSAEVS